MAKRIYAHKDGYISINEIRNFLYGLKNTENSKVYLKVEQHEDGYNYLCVYLDNNYTRDKVTVATHLDEINGFRKWYQLKINKVGE